MRSESMRTKPASLRILSSARRLIEARGFHGVGLEEVASTAGVSRQAVYLHFESKVGLLLALVAHVDHTEGLEPMRTAVWKARSGAEALEAYLDLFLTLTPRILAVALALEAARRSDPVAASVWADRAHRRRATCHRVARLLDEEGALREGLTRREAADLLWSLTSARAYEDLVIDRRWSKPRLARTITATLAPTSHLSISF